MITPSRSRLALPLIRDDRRPRGDDRRDTISPLGTDLRSDGRTL